MSMLFDTVKVNNLTLPNRLVMPPMAIAKTTSADGVSDEICSYYEERAKYSKIGLIITEHCYVNFQGKAHPGQMSIASDDLIAGLKKLTDSIHKEGVKVFAQISHAGTATSSKVTGQLPIGPSAIHHPKQKQELPLEMTANQIREVTAYFADAARRARLSGFDGVEIHSAHGYLLNQFYSPLYNHREDEYGAQSIENRVRFHKEIVQAIREELGKDYPIAVRLGGCDYQEGGSTVDDCVKASRLLESYGVDLMDITGGMNGFVKPGKLEPGYFKDMSIPVKRELNIPVILTGGVTTIEQAETLVENECADLIGVGRAIFKNAHWADGEIK